MLHKKPDIPCGCLIFCFEAQSIRPPASQPSRQCSGGGKALSTAGGGNFDRPNLNRNKRSPRCGAAPIEVADARPVPVYRPEEEVFSPACMASFEGKPVTEDHPDLPEGVSAENIREYQKGHAQNIRRGKGPQKNLLLADE